jgi:phospholipase/carboxylesterase
MTLPLVGRSMTPGGDSEDGPHRDQPLVTAGTDLGDAEAALVLVHGRGATAQSILTMAETFHRPGVALLAPQAANSTWYPRSFLERVELNEPGRTSGLRAIDDAVSEATGAGVPLDRVVILGFSQGGCLGSEYVARNPRGYGGAVAFSGGLVGQEIDPGAYEGNLAGMPFFLGCSDSDPHIPVERVEVTATVLKRLNADVEKRIYPGMGHGVNDDEREYVDGMIAALL